MKIFHVQKIKLSFLCVLQDACYKARLVSYEPKRILIADSKLSNSLCATKLKSNGSPFINELISYKTFYGKLSLIKYA